MTSLPRVRTGLLKHALDKQVLVYDTRTDQVHLLDPTTACVLDLLQEGGWTAEEMTSQIVARLDVQPNEAFLPLALQELRKAGLLEQSSDPIAQPTDVNRRELVRSLAMTGAAALLIPTVATLTATRGYAQGTAPNVGIGGACTTNSQCISNNCCNNACIDTGAVCAGAGTVPNGGACGATNQCATAGAICSGGICQGPDGSACTSASACQSGQCCGGTCRPTGCTSSTASGSCTGVGVPPGNGAQGADPSCCSGFCQREGNSSNYKCTPCA